MRLKKSFLLFGLLGLLVAPILTFNSRQEVMKTAAWSGTQTSTAGTYYASVGNETGQALVSRLNSITAGAKTSYDWSRYEAADEAEGQSDSVLLIYSRKIVKKTEHVSGSTGWNREHSYPQSKIGSPATSDNHHIFADDNKTNSVRGNNPFGVVTMSSSNQVRDGYGNLTDNYSAGGYFMPNPLARGEVARATMYLHVRYGYSVTGNFQSLALMLRWHIENPVTNREIYRNNTVHLLQNNRNPFIDNPDYACRIWGTQNAETQSLCSPQAEVDVTSVSVSPASGSISLLDQNKELQLTANVLPSNATTKTVTWSSSNPSVASVSNTGNVTGLTVGTTTITATSTKDNTKKGTAIITVTNDPIPVTGVTLNDSSLTIAKGGTRNLIASVLPTTATNKNVTWTSDNTNVATVSNGTVTAVNSGVATVTVTTLDGGKTASAMVTVTDAPPAPAAIVTYTFSSKEWASSPMNWSNIKAGFGYEGTRGLQVTGSNSATGNSPFVENVSKVIIGTAASSSGAGTYSAYLVSSPSASAKTGTQIGAAITVNKPGSAIIEREFDLVTPLSGHVQLNIEATGSSLYVKYVKIVTAEVVNHRDDAELWADLFLEDTTEGCLEGSRAALESMWPTLKSEYLLLSNEAKNIIIGSTPNSEGDVIEHAIARYIIIVEKYGLESFIEGVAIPEQTINRLATENRLVVPLTLFFLVMSMGSVIAFILKQKQQQQ